MSEAAFEIGGPVADTPAVRPNRRIRPCAVCRTMKIPNGEANVFRLEAPGAAAEWICDHCAELACPYLMLDLRARRTPKTLSLARDIERLIRAPWAS
jgi:hypothetical protein